MTDPQIERWGEEFASTSDRQVWELLAEFRDEIRAETVREPAAPEFPLPIRADGTHYYVSTGCGCTGDNLMPDGRTGHEYCQGMTGFQGAKRGGRAKCCGAPCQCSCHQDERCSTCGTRVEPLGMVLHFRAEHATPEDLAESSTEDSCRVVEVDGGPIRIHGSGEFTAEDTAAMGEVVATAKKLMATLPPGPLEFECPRCQAVPGQLCRRESGIGGHAPHDERRALAVAAVAGPAAGREDVPLAREATPEEAARMLANLAQSGVETPGCDCGHDGMGASWHRDDCYWRAAL